MHTFLMVLTLLFMVATAVTLIAGVIGMLNPKTSSKQSNKMMRLRIIFQALALIFFAALLWYGRH